MNDLQPIFARYPADCQPSSIESLGAAGGFSGAQFWRIDTARGDLVVRRWPAEHPTPRQLRFIHAVSNHASSRGLTIVPVSVTARSGNSFIEHGGHLWELAPWMPGIADYEVAPSTKKLQAAAKALAQFHGATADFPQTSAGPRVGDVVTGPSSSISRRLDRLRQLSAGGIDELSQSLRNDLWPELAHLARQFIAVLPAAIPRTIAKLEPLARVPLPLQPCLRDIWHDHVLFTGDTVSGLVDFGAMQIETPAGDIARLLGSLVANDAEGWRTGIDAYAAVRPLSPAELQAIAAFDTSGLVLGGCNWIRWIYGEQRQFENHDQVIERFRRIVARL